MTRNNVCIPTMRALITEEKKKSCIGTDIFGIILSIWSIYQAMNAAYQQYFSMQY